MTYRDGQAQTRKNGNKTETHRHTERTRNSAMFVTCATSLLQYYYIMCDAL